MKQKSKYIAGYQKIPKNWHAALAEDKEALRKDFEKAMEPLNNLIGHKPIKKKGK